MTDRTETDEILDGYLTADFDPLQAFVFDDDTDADDEAPSVLAEGPFNMPNPEAAPQFQRDLVAFDNGESRRGAHRRTVRPDAHLPQNALHHHGHVRIPPPHGRP